MSAPVGILLLFIVARPAPARVEFTVTTHDLPADVKPLEPLIRSNLIAAASAWAGFVDAKPCRVEISFRLDRDAPSGRGSGRSSVSARLGDEKDAGGRIVSEQGWASMMRTGVDPNGPGHGDIEVNFEPRYFKTIWWDPHPERRSDRVPPDKLDSMSVLLHELGHALAFNGWIDPKTGRLPGDGFVSTYDRHVKFDGRDFFFVGPHATRLWGGPVPLARTRTNYHHVCETPTGRDALLKPDLMNGIVMEYGRRYDITLLDLAILRDCEVPLKPVVDTPAAGDDNPVRPAPRPKAKSSTSLRSRRN
jgi:hypothetical protein